MTYDVSVTNNIEKILYFKAIETRTKNGKHFTYSKSSKLSGFYRQVLNFFRSGVPI